MRAPGSGCAGAKQKVPVSSKVESSGFDNCKQAPHGMVALVLWVRVGSMPSLAAGNFGISAAVMRPTSPYLKAPPLAHSTTFGENGGGKEWVGENSVWNV
jgi:hypothetical protein